MNYGGYGFMGGGYNDPLGSGMRRPMGYGAALTSGFDGGYPMPPTLKGLPSSMPQPAQQGGRRSVGSFLKGGLDFLTDDEHGAGRLNALTNALGLGLSFWGARQDRNEDQRQQQRAESLEDEDRAIAQSWDPERQAIIQRLMQRRGGG